MAPVPITTMSAGTRRPDSVTTSATRPPSSPAKLSSGSPHTHSTPCSRSTRSKKRPAVGPNPFDSGAFSAITSVQRLPSVVSDAATSQAM